MKIRTRRKLVFLALGVATVGVLSLPLLLSTSCASTSTPYGPYTDFAVTIGNKTLDMKMYTNSKVVFLNKTTNGFNVPIPSWKDKEVDANQVAELVKFRAPGSKIETNQQYVIDDPQLTPNSPVRYQENGKWIEAPTFTVADAFKLLNILSITESVYSNAQTFATGLIRNASSSQAINPSDKTKVQVSKWNEQITNSPLAKEFTLGSLMGAGEGTTSYSLWPSKISMTLKIAPTTQQTTTSWNDKGFPIFKTAVDEKNLSKFNFDIKATNVNLTYQWYKKARTGGEFVTDVKLLNDASKYTGSQWRALEAAGLKTGYTSTKYIIPIANMNFNANSGWYTHTDKPTETVKDPVTKYYLNGLMSVQPTLFDTNYPEDAINASANSFSQDNSSFSVKSVEASKINNEGFANLYKALNTTSASKNITARIIASNVDNGYVTANVTITEANNSLVTKKVSYYGFKTTKTLIPSWGVSQNQFAFGFTDQAGLTPERLNRFNEEIKKLEESNKVVNSHNTLPFNMYKYLVILGYLSNVSNQLDGLNNVIQAVDAKENQIENAVKNNDANSQLFQDTDYKNGVKTLYQLIKISTIKNN